MATALGLDLGKNASWYAAVEERDELVEDGRFESTKENVKELVRKHRPEVVLVEASSVTAWAVDALVEIGAPVWPVHPGSLPGRKNRRRKNDKIDARQLVRLWRAGAITKAWIPPPEHRKLRDLARARWKMAGDRTRFRNRVHSALNQDGQRIQREDVELEGARLFTLNAPDLVLAQRPELSGAYHAEQLLTQEMKLLDQRIAEVSKGLPVVQRLQSVPGFGPITSLALYAEIGDVKRFEKAEQVVAYFGLEPVIEQSSDTVKQLGISHRGPGWIRGLLTQAAWSHVRYAPTSHVTRKYKKLAKRAGKQRAIVATARRLVKVAYWIWRDGTSFQPRGRTPAGPCSPPATVERVN
ncbi:MAG: IS110 family transposase [Actinobacteria bacterium]|nr:IS110 family transposase [Actinomycetota bacterium]